MRRIGLISIMACLACAAGFPPEGRAADDQTKGSFKPLTSPGSITGTGGFFLPMSKPRAVQEPEQQQGTLEPQAPELSQPAQDAPPLPSSLTSGRSQAELAQDQRAPELTDVRIGQKASMTAPGMRRPGEETSDQVRPNAEGLSKREITLAERSPMKHGETEVGTRDTARDTAERFKKDVDASKTNNLGDKFYKAPMQGLWDKADKLYNLAAGWIKD